MVAGIATDVVKMIANDADKNLFFKMIPPYISLRYIESRYIQIIPIFVLLSMFDIFYDHYFFFTHNESELNN